MPMSCSMSYSGVDILALSSIPWASRTISGDPTAGRGVLQYHLHQFIFYRSKDVSNKVLFSRDGLDEWNHGVLNDELLDSRVLMCRCNLIDTFVHGCCFPSVSLLIMFFASSMMTLLFHKKCFRDSNILPHYLKTTRLFIICCKFK